MKKRSRRTFRRWAAGAACGAAVISTAVLAGYAGPVVTPDPLEFGNVTVNTSSPVQLLTVSAGQVPNSASGFDLEIISIDFPTGFARNGGTCPDSGGTSSPCTIGVVFEPTASGLQDGLIEITALVFGLGPGTTEVAVSGTGVPAGAGLPEARPVPMNSLLGVLLLLGGLAGVGAFALRAR